MSAYLIPPSPLDLYIHKLPKITCLVVDLANIKDMNIQWSRESEVLKKKATETHKQHSNMTFTVTSTLPVDANDWIEGVTYQCKVSHPDLSKDIVRTISKAPGEPWPGVEVGEEVGSGPLTGASADPTCVHRQESCPRGLRVFASRGETGNHGHPHLPDPEFLPC